MVKINKIKLETRERFVRIETFFGEKFFDDIGDNVFTFEKGKIYGRWEKTGELIHKEKWKAAGF